MTLLKILGVTAFTAFFYWYAISTLVRGKFDDFGTQIRRAEQPGKFWLQVFLCLLTAFGSTIYAVVVIHDALKDQ